MLLLVHSSHWQWKVKTLIALATDKAHRQAIKFFTDPLDVWPTSNMTVSKNSKLCWVIFKSQTVAWASEGEKPLYQHRGEEQMAVFTALIHREIWNPRCLLMRVLSSRIDSQINPLEQLNIWEFHFQVVLCMLCEPPLHGNYFLSVNI